MIGERFGMPTVVSEVWLTDSYGRRRSGVECICDCGASTTKMLSKVKADEQACNRTHNYVRRRA